LHDWTPPSGTFQLLDESAAIQQLVQGFGKRAGDFSDNRAISSLSSVLTSPQDNSSAGLTDGRGMRQLLVFVLGRHVVAPGRAATSLG
jgi:hypothetical protein